MVWVVAGGLGRLRVVRSERGVSAVGEGEGVPRLRCRLKAGFVSLY